MALHGLIQVNQRVIGEWSAQRLEHLVAEDSYYDYFVDAQVPWRGLSFHATLSHRYSDGAAALAAEVLACAAEFGALR